MPVRYMNGNIVDDDADILTNTVNTVSVMGKGVALAFKTRWPSIMTDYRAVCSDGRLVPGGCLLINLPRNERNRNGQRMWAALATKKHWRDPSRYEWVESGLLELRRLATEVGVCSIAIPSPGCGNGGLDWERVLPMVLSALGDFDLRIYGAPATTNIALF